MSVVRNSIMILPKNINEKIYKVIITKQSNVLYIYDYVKYKSHMNPLQPFYPVKQKNNIYGLAKCRLWTTLIFGWQKKTPKY